MKLDPDTRLGSLLAAIPGSAIALSRLGIAADAKGNMTIQRVCATRGIAVEEFLRAMDEIDWNGEEPSLHGYTVLGLVSILEG